MQMDTNTQSYHNKTEEREGAHLSRSMPQASTTIFTACRDGDKKFVKSWLQRGQDLNAKNQDGQTALACATDARQRAVMKVILEHRGIDPNIGNPSLKMIAPLHRVCMQQDIQSLKVLLKKQFLGTRRVNLNSMTRSGAFPTAIHFVFYEGEGTADTAKNLIDELLKAGADATIKDKVGGDTVLHKACDLGQDVVAKLFLKNSKYRGVVNAVNKENQTALNVACRKGHKKVAQALLKYKGININTGDLTMKAPIHHACRHVEMADVVKTLLKKGAEFTHGDDQQCTPLHLACRHGSVAAAKLLLLKGANVNLKDNEGSTPLHMACQLGHLPIIQLLLENGASLTVKDKQGRIPLHLACSWVEAAALLLEQSDINCNAKDKEQKTPLHYASRGNAEIVRELLAKGANVSSKDSTNQTPLHVAAQRASLETVTLLLAAGGSKDAVDQDGNTPVTYACCEGHFDVVKKLLEGTGSGTSELLLAAAKRGRKKVVQTFLAMQGTNVNAKTQNGLTALHLACEGGHKDVVSLLLKHGDIQANVKAPDRRTPLHYACEEGRKMGHVAVVKMLLARQDVGVNDKLDDGRMPLHLACQGGHAPIVELLLAREEIKGNAKLLDGTDRTPLFLACEGSHVDVVKRLIGKQDLSVKAKLPDGTTALHYCGKEGKADIAQLLITRESTLVNVEDKFKMSPLHYACQVKHANSKNICKMLLAAGGKMAAVDRAFMTPLHFASASGQDEVVELLIKKGAKVAAKTKNKRTALHLASMEGHADVAEILLGANGTVNYVNMQDAFQSTALHLAFMMAKTETMYVLLDMGADINLKDSNEMTPMMYASKSKHRESKSQLDDFDRWASLGSLMTDVAEEKKRAVALKREIHNLNAAAPRSTRR